MSASPSPVIIPRTEAAEASVPVTPNAVVNNRVKSIYSSFNRLAFQAETQRQGFLVLAVSYSRQWQVLVDSHKSTNFTDRNEQAVWLTPGNHKVEFRFRSPSAIAGMLISCLTALVTGLYFAWRSRQGWVRVTAFVAVVVIPAGGFAL